MPERKMIPVTPPRKRIPVTPPKLAQEGRVKYGYNVVYVDHKGEVEAGSCPAKFETLGDAFKNIEMIYAGDEILQVTITTHTDRVITTHGEICDLAAHNGYKPDDRFIH